jgi:hypothetical protein
MHVPRLKVARTATTLKFSIFIAALTVATILPMLSSPSATHADASCSPNGVFLYGTDPSWLNGSAVNVCNNGGNANNDYGVSCVPVAGAPGDNWCPQGNVYADDEWQCVELVNRLYLTKGWTTSYWKGNGGGSQGLIYYLPSGLTDQLNSAISYVNPGDVITLNDGGAGHAAIVNTIDSNSTLHIVNQNTTLSNLYSTASLSSGSLSGRNAYYTSSWFGYTVQAIVHHPVTGGGGGSIYGPTHSDIDHNGIADLVLTTQQSVGTGVYAMLGTGNGFTLPAGWLDLSPYGWSGVTPLVGHENGSTSYADYVFIADEGTNGINVYTAYSNGSSGFASPVLKQSIPGMMYADIKASMGDVDHNGIADVILTKNESTGTGVYVMPGTGNGFLAPTKWLDLSGYGWSGVTPLVGHENGSTSYDDYSFMTNEGANGIKIFTALSNGSSGFSAPVLKQTIPGLMYAGIKTSMGDVDFNGIADLVLTTNDPNGTGVYTMLGTGNGFLGPTQWLDLPGYGWSGVTPLVGHENGNTSNADYIFITDEGANGIKVFTAYSNGSSGFASPVLKQTITTMTYSGVKAYLK